MNTGLRISLIIISFAILCAFFSCLPRRMETMGPVKPISETPVPPVLSSDIVDRKIERFEEILADRQLNDQDMKVAQKMLSDYRGIRNALQGQISERGYRKMIHTLFSSLDMIDERYFTGAPAVDDKPHSMTINELSLKRGSILASYMSGDFQGVIAECSELESTFGPDALTPEIGLLFAVSLARQDLTEAAATIGERIVRELEGRPDLVHLRASLVQWQLDMGNRDRALEIYEKLVDDLDEREALLSSAKQRITEENSTFIRPSDESREIPINENEIDLEMTETETILKEVALLVEDNRFDDARMLLVKQRLKVEDEPDTELLEQALKTVDLAEERYQEALSLEKDPTEQAMKLIEEDRLDEALKILEENGAGRSADPVKTKRLKDFTIEKLVKQERNRAAKIFLSAKGTSDLKKREELLKSSHRILKTLIEKYPSTTLINKLIDNLLKVEEELDKL